MDLFPEFLALYNVSVKTEHLCGTPRLPLLRHYCTALPTTVASTGLLLPAILYLTSYEILRFSKKEAIESKAFFAFLHALLGFAIRPSALTLIIVLHLTVIIHLWVLRLQADIWGISSQHVT